MLESWKLSKEEMVNYWALYEYRGRSQEEMGLVGVGRRGCFGVKSDQGTGVGRDRREEPLERIRDERRVSESCFYVLHGQKQSPANWPC